MSVIVHTGGCENFRQDSPPKRIAVKQREMAALWDNDTAAGAFLEQGAQLVRCARLS